MHAFMHCAQLRKEHQVDLADLLVLVAEELRLRRTLEGPDVAPNLPPGERSLQRVDRGLMGCLSPVRPHVDHGIALQHLCGGGEDLGEEGGIDNGMLKLSLVGAASRAMGLGAPPRSQRRSHWS